MKHVLTLLALLNLFPSAPISALDEAPADPFAVGSLWTGKRRMETENRKKQNRIIQDWSLRITKREGESFAGIIVLESNLAGNRFECEVTGKAPSQRDGAVSFTSEAKGAFKQSFVGKIKGGSIALDFRGKAANGDRVEGEAALSPQKTP